MMTQTRFSYTKLSPMPSTLRRRRSLVAALALSTVALAVSGCSAGLSGAGDGASATPLLSAGIQGRVHGGQQPVSGGTIQLYAVGSTGYKSAASSLMTATVTTGSDGSFTVTGKYTCPSANPAALTYMTASFGNPGMAAGTNNTKLVLMAALGPCNTLTTAVPFISVDEVTTVATVYALSAFMADTTHIGAPATNLTGLTNAFNTANNLANIGTGTAPSLNVPATSAVPVSEIYSLANSISSCVNSDGTGSPCASLLSLTTAGGITPVDTATAVLGVVRNPANQPSAIFNLAPATPPFQPVLSGAPADWSLAVKTTGGALSGPSAVVIDASGNAYVANAGGTSITELSPVGAVLSGSTGYTASGLLGPQSLAFDLSSNLWVANSGGGNVLKLTLSGNAVTGSTAYTAGGVTSPSAIALDTLGNAWVANYNSGTVSGLTSAGAAVAGSPFTTGSQPGGLAIDGSNNIWVTSSGTGIVAKLSNTGTLLSGAGYTDNALLAPGGLAIDLSGNVYVASTGNSAVSVFTNAGAPGSASPIASGVSLPVGAATDGANVAYLTNGKAAGSLSVLSSTTGTPVPLGSLNAPVGLAVDGSGNVWTANSGDNSVSEFVGLGTPVVTPLVNRYPKT